MALVRIPPAAANVRWDRRARRPSVVRWNGQELRITDLDAVRDERSAYPATRGPRVTYLVRTTQGGQASLVFDSRRRRWFIDAVEQAA
jgi:hypothetical protein